MRLVWRALEPSPRERKYTDCQRIGWQKNGKVGRSSTSLKTWVHERSTMVTAKLKRDGLM